jgi:hypothetical protein
MFLPAQYFWLEPVIVAALAVFVIDLIGNTISFSNRFLNALVTSVVVRARLRVACLLRLRQYLDVGQFDTKCDRACQTMMSGARAHGRIVVRRLRWPPTIKLTHFRMPTFPRNAA